MRNDRRSNARRDELAELTPLHRERILDMISRMQPHDEFALPQLIGGDIWYALDRNDRRDLGRRMRTILDEEFPQLEVVPKSRAPLRYRLRIKRCKNK